MTQFFARIDPWLKRYLRFSGLVFTWIGIAMFIVMLVSNTWNIVLRWLFDEGITWHQEVSIMAAMWIYFAAYSLIGKTDTYIRIGFFVDRLPPSVSKAINTSVRVWVIAFFIFLSILTVKGIKVIFTHRTFILEWPEYFYYIPLLVGTSDIIVTELVQLIRSFNGSMVADMRKES
jgi:TRAP-type C4-dicarboxylate transport system permease small subunit